MIKEQIEKDLKQAMLAGDKELVQTLRGLKSAILYGEVADGSREEGMSDEAVQKVLAKEAKKRTESAEMYQQGGDQERADAELAEKKVIEKYLPEQMSEEELQKIVDEAVAVLPEKTPQMMGQAIGAVKAKVGGQADGARIAQMVKEKLQ